MNQAQYLLMFGGCTEADFWADFRRRNCCRILEASCNPALPASAMGYIAHMQQSENLSVLADAQRMVQRYIPNFKLWGI